MLSVVLILIMTFGFLVSFSLINKIFPRFGEVQPLNGIVFVFYPLALYLRRNFGEKKTIINYGSIVGLITGFTGFAIILGYLFELPFFYGGDVFPVSLSRGICDLFLGTGLIALCGKNTQILGPLSGDSVNSKLQRVIIPFVIFGVVSQSLLFIVIERHSSVSFVLVAAFEVVIFVLISIFLGTGVTRKIFIDAERAEEERRRVMGTLKLAEEKYLKIFGASPAPVMVTRAKDGTFLEANDAAVKMIGRKKEDIIGKTSLELGVYVDPEDRKKVIEQLGREGSAFGVEVRQKRTNGEEVLLRQNYQVFDLDGEKCVLTISEDITEKKKTEEKVHDLNTELQQRNQWLTEINELFSGLNNLVYGASIGEYVSRKLTERPEVAAAWFSAYDPDKKTLVLSSLELKQKGILSKGIAILGKSPREIVTPVSEENLKRIFSEIVAKHETLTELSFGVIHPLPGAAVKKLLGEESIIYFPS